MQIYVCVCVCVSVCVCTYVYIYPRNGMKDPRNEKRNELSSHTKNIAVLQTVLQMWEKTSLEVVE